MAKARLVVAFSACVLLTGCDEIEKFENKQADAKRRIQQLEEQMIEVQSKLRDLATQSKGSSMSFNGCVLENMKGINSDLAAEFIKVSCLEKVSMQLPVEHRWPNASAGYGQIHRYVNEKVFGLYVEVNNESPYDITEITITIVNKKTKIETVYVARSFPSPVPPGTIIAGLPRDRTAQMRLPPGTHTFTIPISESANDQTKFFEQYDWGITANKGFVN